MTSIGPVQYIAVGFPEDATYEGRIITEIKSIEASGSLRVLDVLFVRKDPDTGELQTLDIQSEELQSLAGTTTLGVSRRELEDVGEELAPGQAAGMLLVDALGGRRARGDQGPRTPPPGRIRQAGRSLPRPSTLPSGDLRAGR